MAKRAVAIEQGKLDKRVRFRCRFCGSGRYHEDPATRRRYCIPCENLKEARRKASKARWEKKRPRRDRNEYQKAYRERRK